MLEGLFCTQALGRVVLQQCIKEFKARRCSRSSRVPCIEVVGKAIKRNASSVARSASFTCKLFSLFHAQMRPQMLVVGHVVNPWPSFLCRVSHDLDDACKLIAEAGTQGSQQSADSGIGKCVTHVWNGVVLLFASILASSPLNIGRRASNSPQMQPIAHMSILEL